MKKSLIAIIVASAVALSTQAVEGHDHDSKEKFDHSHEHGSHANAGRRVTVEKGVADVVIQHSEATGFVELKFFKTGSKEAFRLDKAPRINVTLKEGRTQVRTIAVNGDKEGRASIFRAASEYLKGHVHAVIRTKINGNSSKVDLMGHSDHKH